MAAPTLHDLKLIGTTATNGGPFRRIKITGDSVMSGDVAAESLACVGEVEIQGALQVKQLKLTGQCSVQSGVQADRIQGVGELAIGSLRCGQVKLSGHIRAERSCEAETFKLLGWLEVGELISAERLTLDLHGRCRAREVGGGTVTVKRSKLSKIKSFLSLKEAGTLAAELIEGDTVYLEHVTVDTVRGAHVTIGAGCRIGRVEYRESLKRHPRAEVGSEVRV